MIKSSETRHDGSLGPTLHANLGIFFTLLQCQIGIFPHSYDHLLFRYFLSLKHYFIFKLIIFIALVGYPFFK